MPTHPMERRDAVRYYLLVALKADHSQVTVEAFEEWVDDALSDLAKIPDIAEPGWTPPIPECGCCGKTPAVFEVICDNPQCGANGKTADEVPL